LLDRAEDRFIVNEATLPCVLALQADTPLPFAARSDVDKDKPKDKKEEKDNKDKKADDKDKAKEDEKVEPIRIDFDGLMDRFVQVPVAPGNYSDLTALDGKLHWLKSPNRGMSPYESDDPEEEPGADLLTYEIEKEKLSTIASGVKAYEVSMDHKVLVYQTKEGFVRVEAG